MIARSLKFVQSIAHSIFGMGNLFLFFTKLDEDELLIKSKHIEIRITKQEVYQEYRCLCNENELYFYSKDKLLELNGQLSIEAHQTFLKCV